MARKNSPEYWEHRIASHTWNTYNSLEDKNRALLELYQDASKNIREELYALAEKYSKDGVLSRTDIHKQNRLAKLEKRYRDIVEDLGHQTQETTEVSMKQGFQEVYQSVRSEIDEVEFALPNKKLMEELLEKPWYGNDFSSRIWRNQKLLSVTLNDKLLTGLQQGKTVTEIAIELTKVMKTGFDNAHRLVRTETMHYLNSAALKGYKDAGIEYVQFWAAKDERTCDQCGELHEKPYPIDKAPILPLHPHCRCTYLPVTDEELIQELLDQNKEDVILKETTDKWAKEARMELLKDERTLAGRKKETSVIYGPDGKYLFQKRGTENAVRFSISEALKLKGCVVTHNHPNGGSFSIEDIQFLRKSGASEVRVSTEECSYYLRQPEKWPKEIKTSEALSKAQEDIRRELRGKYQKLYKAGKITKEQRYTMWLDDVNRTFAERYGFDYGKE